MKSVRRITGADGKPRFVCRFCSKSYHSNAFAATCCHTSEIRYSSIPSEHALEEAVTLEANPAPQPIPDTPEPEMRAMPPVQAPELLGRAAAHMHERGKTYDKPEGERSMGKCIAAFNAITGRDLRESEGWLLMQVLKLVRSETRSEPHTDSLEDNIAYSALYAEARGQGL